MRRIIRRSGVIVWSSLWTSFLAVGLVLAAPGPADAQVSIEVSLGWWSPVVEVGHPSMSSG